MKQLLAACLLVFPLCGFAEEPDPNVVMANRVLQAAGFPTLPDKAREMQCYAWSGLSAGIYATWLMDGADFDAHVGKFGGMEMQTPIPASLLAPPNAAAPWFAPGGLKGGQVWFLGRIARAAPELFRLYASREEGRLCLFYTWNNKSMYP